MTGVINSSTVSTLFSNYTFPIIPDCPAATAAGYTTAERDAAQLWYPPVIDGDYFYYGGWNGEGTSFSYKSTIMVCRRCDNGSLVWATNCKDYQLDLAPNFLGDSATVCRCQPFILDNTIYLVKSNLGNIGPELYAVDKSNGNLRWACAYYTPNGAYITTKGNYGAFATSTMRLGSLAPVAAHVTVNGVDKKYVFVGTSSLQNNFSLNYILSGFPKYTDQGFLFCIEDQDISSSMVWSAPTCAPILKVGDTIVKGGAPEFDPFQPSESKVLLESMSTPSNYFVQPHFLANPPAPALPNTCPVAAVVNFTKTTPISASLVQPLWGLLGQTIYQDDNRTQPHTLTVLLANWTLEQAALPAGGSVRHIIWAYVNSSVMTSIQAQPGNFGVVYFKFMTSGQSITESYDAQSLNYWGNGVWGARPTLDLDRNLIYFSTGQAHAIPLDESLFYQQPEYNFFTLKVPVVDAISRYVAGVGSLSQVKKQKRRFVKTIEDLALDVDDKSPRGRMSYSDAVMGVYITPYTTRSGTVVPAGTRAFGVRIVPCDSYTFLNDSPISAIYPLNVLDGDASSGVKMFKFEDDCDEEDEGVFLATVPKCALIPIVDVTKVNPNVMFNDNNLNRKGVFLKRLVFGGPNSSGGGSSYQNDATDNELIGSQVNISFIPGGARGSDGAVEAHVTEDGRIFFPGNSFVESIKIPSGQFRWETDLNERANGEIVVHNGVAYTETFAGNLYALSTASGAKLWQQNGTPLGLYGGIVGPAVSDTQVIWANNYVAFGSGFQGPNGASFVVPA
jgi:outer membrane protein assembly factor BamB